MPIVCITNLSPDSVRAAHAAAACRPAEGAPDVVRRRGARGPLRREALPRGRRARPARGRRPSASAPRAWRCARLLTLQGRRVPAQRRGVPQGRVVRAGRRGLAGPRLAPHPACRSGWCGVHVCWCSWCAARRPLVDWARGRRRLAVMVGVDASDEADGSVGLHPGAARGGAVRRHRHVRVLARGGAHAAGHPQPRARWSCWIRWCAASRRWIRTWSACCCARCASAWARCPGRGRWRLHLEPGYGRRDDHLLHVARERRGGPGGGGHAPARGACSGGGTARCPRAWCGTRSSPWCACRPRTCGPGGLAAAQRAGAGGLHRGEPAGHCPGAHAGGPGGGCTCCTCTRAGWETPDWTDHYGVLPEPRGEREEVTAAAGAGARRSMTRCVGRSRG